MARPDTHSDVDDGGVNGGADDASAAAPEEIPPGTGVVRPGAAVEVPPGTGVVRPGAAVEVPPGTGVVRPGTGVVAPADSGAKARAVVPEAPGKPLDPIHVVLPVIPVKPAKQGFLDRLVAPKPKKLEPEPKPKKKDRSSAREASIEAPPPVIDQPPPAPLGPRPPLTVPTRPGPVGPPPGPPSVRGGRGPGPDAYPGAARRPMGADRRGAPAPWESYADDWPADGLAEEPVRIGRRWVVAVVIMVALAGGGGVVAGVKTRPQAPRWLTAASGPSATAVLPGLAENARRPTPSGMAARISPLLADGRLGSRVSVSVVDAATGDPLFDRSGSAAATPASTAKLLTATAVLAARGPEYRLSTRVVAGDSPGEVVLIGGGDPTLAAGQTATYPGAARLDLLAGQVTKALDGQAPTRVVLDTSLYSGPTMGPGWSEFDISNGHIARVTALMTDGARRNPKATKGATARYSQPDLAAGQAFARALGLPTSAVTFGRAGDGAQALGEVRSPPMARLVELMLLDSDNVIAEALARQVALAKGGEASFDGAARATRDVLTELSLPVEAYGLVDGSGLSEQNRVSANLLTAALVRAASPQSPALRSVLTGLPVAGYSGTLTDRYRRASAGGSAAGVIRAKTGTLSHVNSLAGVVVDVDGRLLAFSIVADQTPSDAATVVLDLIAAAIASCGC